MRRVLYFVGAGLTKALQTSDRVPLMADFVSVMSRHTDDPIIAQVLAEYERDGVFRWPSTPLSRRLAERVLDGDVDALAAFGAALRCRPTENVETLLQKAVRRDGRTAELFKRAINRVLLRLHPTLNLELLRRFVSFEARRGLAEHQVISFNYDLSLDTVLKESGLWHPATGYGVPFVEYLDPVELEAKRVEEESGRPALLEQRRFAATPPSSWLLLKPHGSLNWVWSYHKFGPRGLSVIASADGAVTYAGDTHVPGSVYAGPMSGVPFAIAIAPPGEKNLFDQKTNDRGDKRGEEFAHLQHLAIRNADEVYVIGWSMPPTDAYHSALIRVCCEERRRPVDRLVVINSQAPVEYFERIQEAFGEPKTLEAHNDGFAQYLGSIGA